MRLFKQIFLFFTVTLLFISCGTEKKRADSPLSMRMPLLTSPEKHGEGVGWGRTDCVTCHITEKTHPNKFQAAGKSVEESCVLCHLGNGVYSSGDIPACVSCHTGVTTAGTSLHKVSAITPAGRLTDRDCAYCHQNTDMNGVFDTTRDLLSPKSWDTSKPNSFCAACHSGEGITLGGERISASDIKRDYEDSAHGAVECLTCHTQHASNNRRLVRGEVNGINVSVPAPGGDSRDLCAVCHTGTGVPAPNGRRQVTNHGEYCDVCHDTDPNPVPKALYSTMMATGAECGYCHTHIRRANELWEHWRF